MIIRIIWTIGRDLWALLFGYGRRWLAEVFFSVFKKAFRDNAGPYLHDDLYVHGHEVQSVLPETEHTAFIIGCLTD